MPYLKFDIIKTVHGTRKDALALEPYLTAVDVASLEFGVVRVDPLREVTAHLGIELDLVVRQQAAHGHHVEAVDAASAQPRQTPERTDDASERRPVLRRREP